MILIIKYVLGPPFQSREISFVLLLSCVWGDWGEKEAVGWGEELALQKSPKACMRICQLNECTV